MPKLGCLAGWTLLITVGLPLPSHGVPIVFDFEDGLQGWELHGSAQRVQTQVPGGEWAIFGDGFLEEGAFISIPLDLVTSAASRRTADSSGA